ncbi:GSCFA domain-containing protein [Sulfitobacter sp. JB4-11]|uniref:GSCFA domain-containing protein n=1 Tax=Sulfitobacter rhodophyticola TaxID=3238304 RepID=UPI003511DF76
MNRPLPTPYADLADRAFWKNAVNARSLFDIADLWTPKFSIGPKMPVATYGSCFAQHLGRALRARDYNWLNAEPGAGQSPQTNRAFHYGVFSARTGRIDTTTLLLQWVRWAVGDITPPDAFWNAAGRFHDPFRPSIEPQGFASMDEAKRSRQTTIDAFATSIRKARVFVLTLGQTERWRHLQQGYEYPLCPGHAGGQFDPDTHGFDNLGFAETLESLWDAIKIMRRMNPKLRLVLSVSPVPLSATMSGQHVIPATTYSKSVLRAVCGELVQQLPHVDYFPAYEILSSPAFRASFFEPNQRDITRTGVEFVMEHFFDGHAGAQTPTAQPDKSAHIICKDALLANERGMH